MQIVSASISRFDADIVRQALGRNAGVIADVVPEVAAVVPDLEEPPLPSDPNAGQFRLYNAIASFLRSLARQNPLVLVLEDLHWADKGTLQLLEFIAQDQSDSHTLILGTYRDTEVTADHSLFYTLGDLTRSRHFTRITLAGLDIDDVTAILRQQSAWGLSSEISASIHSRTHGNPLFVGEMSRYLDQEGLLAGGAHDLDLARLGLPEGIREVIGRRLSKLSAYSTDVLTIAAILGREFTLQRLSAIATEQSSSELIEVLGEAISSRIIEEVASRPGRYQFTHALIQQALREQFDLPERVRLHVRVAESLEAIYGDDADQHSAELAYHYSEAEPVAGTGRLIYYSILAGEEALNEFAPESAIAQFSNALAAMEDLPMDETRARALRGIGLGHALVAQMQQTHESLRLALEFYLDREQFDQAIEIAVQPIVNIFRSVPDRVSRFTKMLSVVEPGSVNEAILQSRYAVAMSWDADVPHSEVDEAFERAVSILEPHRPVRDEAWVVSRHGKALFFRNEFQAALEKFEESLKLTEGFDDALAEVEGFGRLPSVQRLSA